MHEQRKVRSMQSDAKYFANRAAEEFIAGAEAKHPEARRAHLELAVRYDDLARHITLQDQLIFGGDADEERPASDAAKVPPRLGLWL
jgi:hypothetical protein